MHLRVNCNFLAPCIKWAIHEQLLFFATLVGRKILQMKIKPYIPDFKLAFEHFCIHAGGTAVLDELEKNLQLSEWHMKPSRISLYRFGNTSSSSLWYKLAYSEAKGRIRKGERTWKIALGPDSSATVLFGGLLGLSIRVVRRIHGSKALISSFLMFPVFQQSDRVFHL